MNPANPTATAEAASAPAAIAAAVAGLWRRKRRRPGRYRWLMRTASLAVATLAWQVASRLRLNLGVIDFANVADPSEVVGAALELVRSPKLAGHVGSSLVRVFAGFAAAALAGIAVGLLVGRSRRAEDALMPPLEVLRPIPGVAWIPLAILMFPSAELSMVFITFIGAFFPILLATVHGVEALDQRIIASARCLGAGRWLLFRDIVLPGALPQVVTGLAIGMGTSWFCLVTAEMIAGQYGIGYYTWEAYNLQRYPDIVVGMLVIGAFGMGSSALVRRVGRALTPWYQPRGEAHGA
jgi:NitT/TauT family transport system permease protein